MKIKSYYGWSVAIPGWTADIPHWLPCAVFATRKEAIQSECWNLGEVAASPTRSIHPWLHTDPKEVSRAWKRLYQRGFRAVRVEVRALLFGKDREP